MTCKVTTFGVVCLLLALAGCAGVGHPAQSAGKPAADEWTAVTTVPLAQGVASGDVTSRSARIWLRTLGAARVELEWAPDGQREGTGRRLVTTTSPEQDFTATVLINDLQPSTRYRYRVTARRTDVPSAREIVEETGSGTFRTAPADEASVPFTFLWSGDLGGQKRCRDLWVGYPIFYRMLQARPDFFIDRKSTRLNSSHRT